MQNVTLVHRDARPADGSLVEREAALAALSHALDETRTGRGRLVIVRGEAGIGKTALVRAFLEGIHSGIRVAKGSCDGFATPRPFAPLEDMVPTMGRALAEMLEGGAHGSIARWLRERLSRMGPWVLVVEDIQWADDATLALLVYLARRLEGLSSLVLITCRDDEALAPPVEQTLGSLAAVSGVVQLPLARLSRQGVAELAAGSSLDVDELARLTSGNPLFIGEVLRSGGGQVPVSIRDAIRARLNRLGGRARRGLEAAAVAGAHPEPWLVAALAGEDVLGVDECVRGGLLVKTDVLVFHHELTRMVVMDELPVVRAIALHRRALETLRRAGSTDHARLAHHAEAAGDAAATVQYASAAGRQAEAMSALREAAVQFRRATRFAGHLGPAERADLLERLANVLYLRNELAEAYALGEQAVELRRGGDVRALASSLSAHALIAWLNQRGDEAWALARQAAHVLEGSGDSRELGMAWNMIGRLAVSAGLDAEARASSRRALEIGNRLGDAEVRSVALANIGTVAALAGDRSGFELIDESLKIGREAQLAEVVDRALNNLGVCAAGLRDFRRAEEYFAALAEFGSRSEIVRCSIDAPRAEIALALGDAASAERFARAALGIRDPLDRALAQIVLARLEVRRGGSDVDSWLAEARELAGRLEATQLRWPLLLCEAEQAWLGGHLGDLVPALREAYAEACDASGPWAIGGFGRWLWVAGEGGTLDERAALPYRLEIRGDRAGAAREWQKLEMPYEAALCFATGDDLADLRRAHAEMLKLGAPAVADWIRARIRDLGGSVPRGPRRTTRADQHGLTAREAEVAGLLARGFSNAEIAQQLVLSSRTVGHHVSAILAKLDLERRSQVASAMSSQIGR
jgi:DNA-binding CsgD family transcriptional regulator